MLLRALFSCTFQFYRKNIAWSIVASSVKMSLRMKMTMKAKKKRDFHIVVNTSTNPRVPLLQLVRGKERPKLPLIIIKDVVLKEHDYMLVVNGGEREISFISRKAGERIGDESATKLFKVLRILWGERTVIRNKKILKLKGVDSVYMDLKSLMGNSESPSIGAVRQIIKRLNRIFRQNGLAISIKEIKGKCKLIIKKGMA